MRLATLHWPPYVDEKTQSGSLVELVKRVGKQAGYHVEIEFYPWARVKSLAAHNDRYAGYFPEYLSDEIAEEFLVSESIGEGPLVLAERVEKPIVWNDIQDLTQYKIGVVLEYVNTAELDAMIAKGAINAVKTIDDRINLKMLLRGRIDASVIDLNVMNHLLNTDDSLIGYKTKIQHNSKPLENKQLFVCFKKSPKGDAFRTRFNKALTLK